MKDIVQVAVEADSFNMLASAVRASGLTDTLRGPGPFTVFAPSDGAFAKLPRRAFELLMADASRIAAVLKYHVVPGRWTSADIVESRVLRPQTVHGNELELRYSGGNVYADGARVVTADIPASNGVIHIIDGVLLPRRPQA